MQVKSRNPLYMPGVNDKEYSDMGIRSSSDETNIIKARVMPEFVLFNESVPLIKYMPKIKEKAVRNLLDDNP